jgi:hypothetical protein
MTILSASVPGDDLSITASEEQGAENFVGISLRMSGWHISGPKPKRKVFRILTVRHSLALLSAGTRLADECLKFFTYRPRGHRDAW